MQNFQYEDEDIQIASNPNLDVVSSDGDYYTRDEVKNTTSITDKQIAQAQADNSIKRTTTSSTTTQSEDTKVINQKLGDKEVQTVQTFEGYYDYGGSDFKNEIKQAYKDAIVNDVVGIIPRMTTDLIDAVAKDQTKYMMSLLLMGDRPAPEYTVSIGLKIDPKDDVNYCNPNGPGRDDFIYFDDVQKFNNGIRLKPINLYQSSKENKDPNAMREQIDIKFGLTNVKKFFSGTKAAWDDFANFMNLYSDCVQDFIENGADTDIGLKAVVKFKAQKPKELISVGPLYSYEFYFEDVRTSHMAFYKLTKFGNKHTNLLNFHITGFLTQIETVPAEFNTPLSYFD